MADLPEPVQRYAEWHKSAFGWNPFEPITCFYCKEPLPIMDAYRCYDCRAACHQGCLKLHCAESRQLDPSPMRRQDANVEHWAMHLRDEEKELLLSLLTAQKSPQPARRENDEPS